MTGDAAPPTVAAEVMNVILIGIIGTIVLLPLALLGLAVGLVRFGVNAIRALVAETAIRAGQRLAFHA